MDFSVLADRDCLVAWAVWAVVSHAERSLGENRPLACQLPAATARTCIT